MYGISYMMTYLRNSIIATVVYHDTFNYPLTLLEVFKYLINPGRLMRIADGLGEIKLDEVSEELDRLIKSGILAEKNGFYFLNGRDDLYDLRIEIQKIADQKWKKFLKLTRFLALAPYLRGVFASGSMALGNTDKESDFDVLIIAKSGRLYTCRFFLWLVISLLGARRKKNEKVAPDKLCFNHYITDDSLLLRHQSLFNAQAYINLKPVMIRPELVNKFFSSNLWLNNYAYNFKVQNDFVMRSINPPRLLRLLARIGELTLNFLFGDRQESFLMHYQQKLIKNNPITYEPGGRTVFTDKELEFHPHSFEKTDIKKNKKRLK